MKKVCLIGGNGFVGTCLIEKLVKRGHQVYTYVEKQPSQSVEGCTYFTGDLSESGTLARIMKGKKFDCVIHNAAISHPGMCKDNPHKLYHVNVVGTLNVLEAAALADVPKVVYISSGAVYGNVRMETVREDSLLCPISPYGASKVAGEAIVKNYGLDTISLRLSCVYGPGRVTPEPIKNLLTDAIKSEKIEWATGMDQNYDYVYIEDCVEGILQASLADSHHYDVYNIGGGEEVTFQRIVNCLRQTDVSLPISIGGGTLGYDNHGPFCLDRMEKDFGWTPKITIEEGIRRYYAYLKQHPEE